MADAETTAEESTGASETALEGQTYEIIRKRLATSGEALRSRLAQLNEARKEVFGSIETKLLSTERVTTSNNCVPRDMVAIGDQLLFGYNVHFGLKAEVNLEDVFGIYQYQDHGFHQQSVEALSDPQFTKDFKDLYKYYKHTTFVKLALRPPHLFMVFRVGKGVDDIKTFKWSIEGDRLRYLDNRSDHQFGYPSQHEFVWQRATREQHRTGVHPHISIDDRLFVETVGGDLTIKVEDNTASGHGIYAEDVEDADQTLDDADIQYAILGNIILLKILPYQEKQYRYIVYNEKIQQARRIDAIADACVLLPDDHGLIFSNGYYLQTGEVKTFQTNVEDTVFARKILSPGGEDYLYVFYNRRSGTYVLLSYNLISQEVSTPHICNGYAHFENGELISFRHHDDPQKHHAIQIWQTPYVGQDYAPHAQTDSMLFKIGNRDLVRCMAECHEVLNLINKEDTYANLYLDLVKETTDVIDSYFWVDSDEGFHLKDVLVEIRDVASGAISQYEKVVRVRRDTQEQIARVTNQVREAISTSHGERFEDIGGFVRSLASLRSVRGEIITLRDLRYTDPDAVDTLEEEVREETDRMAARCVDFLLEPNSLAPYEAKIENEHAQIDALAKVSQTKEVQARVDEAAADLEMLIEVVSNLKIDDATQRTTIIDGISAIFSRVNQTRAALKSKMQQLMSVEGAAEFHSQLKLLDQAVVNYLDICDTSEKCEEFLTKVMIQIEEMEGRFSEFDEFIEQLAEKRDEIYNAFEARRLALVEARNRRASTLMKSAERILKGCKTRVDSLESISEINGYFASDMMIEKVRDIVEQLTELDDTVKVDDIQSRLKTIKEDSIRQLKDRQELYVDGQNIIQLGKHKFSVNVQNLDLTTVRREDEMCYHLTGTNFFEAIEDEQLLANREVWQQETVSENRDVYRAEYLAYLILTSAGTEGQPTLADLRGLSDEALLTHVQQFMSPRYAEGYIKGVHDHDATTILRALVELQSAIGLLRYSSPARSLGWLFWVVWEDPTRKLVLESRLKGFGKISHLFPDTTTQQQCIDELRGLLNEFVQQHPVLDGSRIAEASEYLFHALARDQGFSISREADQIVSRLHEHLEIKGFREEFTTSLAEVRQDSIRAFALARDWVGAFLDDREDEAGTEYAEEAALLLLEGEHDESRVVHTTVTQDLTGLHGTHAVIQDGGYHLHFNEFIQRVGQFAETVVPAFGAYTHRKHELVETFREELRLDEFRPRVLTSFVRNQLIDKVYLPMIGDNLAKQIGTAGESKRTDRMGMLLVISPPGYGKTTLMEYIANRLGIIFMKINGPAIGHQVTSLDPVEAPNAAAREEVEKLNLSLEMGDNVMLYLDDIQHCNPEFLQKFISLCDATRKIEGVYKGRTRTYDLRGRKVCVVMAGNPYTESGEKFQIPDMLANRADTYNLGEILGDNRDVFEMSYLENSLTSNPTLATLAQRSSHDVYAFLKMAAGTAADNIELEGNYSLDEQGEIISTLQKMMRVRDVVLTVNRQYIQSAAQSDEYRTEPAFKLQGSYRNMNKIAEKVSPIMNDEELETLIYSLYENDAQTLTTGAEANLLKFKELTGGLSEEDAARWDDIKRTFQQNTRMRGIDTSDKFGQVIAQMAVFSDGLNSIRGALSEGVKQLTADQQTQSTLASAVDHLAQFGEGLQGLRETLTGGLAELRDQSDVSPTEIKATFAPEALEKLSQLATELKSAADGEGQKSRHKIHITNKVPRTILAVIREQFKLMETWMKPLVESTHSQSAGIQQLQSQLKKSMKSYQSLLGEIEEED